MAKERWTCQLQTNPRPGLVLWRYTEQDCVMKTGPPMLLWVGRCHYCMKSACLGKGTLPRKGEVFSSGKRSIKITGATFLPPVCIIYLLIFTSQLTRWPICGVGVNRQNERKQVFTVISGRCGASLIPFSPEFDMMNGGLLPFVLTYVFTTALRNRHKSIQLGFDPEKYLSWMFSFVLHYRIDSNFIWCFCFSVQQEKRVIF